LRFLSGKQFENIVIALFLLLFITFLFTPVLTYSDEDINKVIQSKNDNQGDEVIPRGEKDTLKGGEVTPSYDYKEPQFSENRVSYPFLVLKTLAILAVIIIVIYILFRFLLKRDKKIIADNDIIKVISTYPLASNKKIQIIDIAGKLLVLGVTESNINLITDVEDKEIIDKIKLLSSKETKSHQGFKDQFLRLLRGEKLIKGTGELSYLNQYKNRIKRIKKL